MSIHRLEQSKMPNVLVFPFVRCCLAAAAISAVLSATGCESKRTVGETVDGQPHGKWAHWYASGQREMAGEYQKGREVGPWEYWYENGQRLKSGTYAQGRENGTWTEWYDNGQKKASGDYSQGEKSGIWRTWHENGQLATEEEFDQGALIRSIVALDDDGNPVGEGGGGRHIPTLIKYLRDRSSSQAQSAMDRLRGLGEQAVPALVEVLREKDTNNRLRAVTVLSEIANEDKMGMEAEASIAPLVSLLEDPEPEIARVAADALMAMGPRTVPELARFMDRTSSSQGLTMGSIVLSKFGAESAPAIAGLAKALRYSAARSMAGKALATIGPPAVPQLINALQDNSSLVRQAATQSLGEIGPEAKLAVEALIEMLADRSTGVHNAAIVALGNVGEATVEKLMETLKSSSKSDEVRDRAARALGAVGEPAIPVLLEELKNKDSEIRYRAAYGFKEMGRTARSVAPVLKQALARERDETVEFYLKAAVQRVGD